MTFSVRRLAAGDLAAYRALRLEALAAAPTAFGSDVSREQAFSEAAWLDRLVGNATFGAFEAGELVGIATLARLPGAKRAHRADVVGVYLKPAARGRGASRLLLDTLIATARETVVQLHLTVTAGNAPARRLYERLGFRIYGTEPRSLCYEGHYYDEHLMVLRLDEGRQESDDR